MSAHGGLLGALLVMWLYSARRRLGFWRTVDFVAPLVPLGLLAGRIGNFINGELWGRPASAELPWAMIFPQAGDGGIPRHPSQLYEAGLEGLALFLLLWAYSKKPHPADAFPRSLRSATESRDASANSFASRMLFWGFRRLGFRAANG